MSTIPRVVSNARDRDGDEIPLLVELLPQDRELLVASILGAGDLANGEAEEEDVDDWAVRLVTRARALVKASDHHPKKRQP